MTEILHQHIAKLLASIPDPEIPVLSIMDLGIVRDFEVNDQGINVTITPTYSGCPAMDTIQDDIKQKLGELGYKVSVQLTLSPAWTTDWLSEVGKEKLANYGIAPPMERELDKKALIEGKRVIKCPHCGSTNTEMQSQFGSTACKALFRCIDCLEPFDYFKCL